MNVYGDLPERRDIVSAESLIAAAPDVLVVFPCCGPDAGEDESRAAIDEIVATAVRTLAEPTHPDAFS